jgi:transcriptional regulator with XRE-family HTH domain
MVLLREASPGDAIRRVRNACGYSARELARRAGISAAQVSRIESGLVEQPSVATLVALAQALDRNPKPLLILAGHVPRLEALAWLRRVVREHRGSRYDPAVDSELVSEWEHGWQERLDEARRLLAEGEPDTGAVGGLAADVFFTSEAEETMWLGSWLAPEREADTDLQALVELWQQLAAERRAKVLDYAAEQVELTRVGRLRLLETHEEGGS